jgi:hypothetical protein
LTRKERLELNRQELAELTKIAKVILIDGFNSLSDEGAITSCNGLGDTGNWEWIHNAGTKQYKRGAVIIKPSSSKQASAHIEASYEYDVINSSGVIVNTTPSNSQSQLYYTNYNYTSTNALRRADIILLEKFLKRKNYSTRSLLKAPISLKISRRPNEEEVAWALSVLENEDVKENSGSFAIEMEYSVKVKDTVHIKGANGAEDAVTKATDKITSRVPDEYIYARVSNPILLVVTGQSFTPEVIHVGSVSKEEFDKATEI